MTPSYSLDVATLQNVTLKNQKSCSMLQPALFSWHKVIWQFKAVLTLI